MQHTLFCYPTFNIVKWYTAAKRPRERPLADTARSYHASSHKSNKHSSDSVTQRTCVIRDMQCDLGDSQMQLVAHLQQMLCITCSMLDAATAYRLLLAPTPAQSLQSAAAN
jgi:hypothetical protein